MKSLMILLIFFLFSYNLLASNVLSTDEMRLIDAEKIIAIKDNPKYFLVKDKKSKIIGFLFKSAEICPEITGYVNHIPIIVYIDNKGIIRHVFFMENNETPSYMDFILNKNSYLSNFLGRSTSDTKEVDSISGATFSSSAIKNEISRISDYYLRIEKKKK